MVAKPFCYEIYIYPLLGFLLISFVAALQDPSVKNFDTPKNLFSSEKEYKKSEPEL